MGGSDVGIIIEGSIILLTETVKVQTDPTWPFYLAFQYSYLHYINKGGEQVKEKIFILNKKEK